MRNPYESNITEIAQSASEAITACQHQAEETGVEIIAFALESVRADVLAMVKASVEREKLFGAFISNIAENLDEDLKAWQKSWKSFCDNGGVYE
jgi:hypothetical protein